jgi:hypothetical protein
MPTLVVFDLVSALVNVCTTAVPAGVNVYDGQPADDDPSNFLMVGVGDPDSTDAADSANGNEEWAGLGHRASKEYGAVACCAVAWTGDVGNDAQRAAREAVRDIYAAVEANLRTDPNLGGVVPGLNWVRIGGSTNSASGSWSLKQLSATDGVAVVFRFDIAYMASL